MSNTTVEYQARPQFDVGRPLAWVWLVISVLVLAFTFAAASSPGGSGFLMWGFIPLMPGVAFSWLVIGVALAATQRRALLQRWETWFVAALLLVWLVGSVTSLPLKLRFELAKDDLASVAEQTLTRQPSSNIVGSQKAGSYDVRAERLEEGALLQTGTGMLIDDCAFFYLEDGKQFPGTIHYERISLQQHLGGHWWATCYSW